MSMEQLLEILDRTRTGPVCTLKEWNTKVIPTKVSQKLKEHGLSGTCNKENPVNTDDALADEFFKAGYELALDMGLLCQDTERVVKVTEEEIRDAIKNAPSEIALGKGRDRVVIKHRKPEDKHPPKVQAVLGMGVLEEMWLPLHQAIAQLREIDIFSAAPIDTIFGRPVLGGTPYETLVGRYEAQLTREALWRAGRPGMPTKAVLSSPTEFGQLGGFGIKGGFDPDNSIALCLGRGDMLTAYTILHKVAHAINCGSILETGYENMIGGYPGPPEGAALVQIATDFLYVVIHQATFLGTTVIDTRYSGGSGREALWAQSIATQANARNGRFLKDPPMDQVAGPSTEMFLYECAVEMMNLSASGVAMALVPQCSVGPNYLTPLECKFCAEVLKCSAGMTRNEANEIAKVLIPRYEAMLFDPPKGKTFQECYDLKTLRPTQEWIDIYLKVKKELIELGVPLEYP